MRRFTGNPVCGTKPATLNFAHLFESGPASPVVLALFLVAISRYVVDRPDLAKPILEGKG